MAGNPKSEIIILKEFFGFKEDQKLADFSIELKQLATEEKHKMACEAARAMGLKQDDVSFTLDK